MDKEKKLVDPEQLGTKLIEQLQHWQRVRDNLVAQVNLVTGRITQIEEMLNMLQDPSETLADSPSEST